jgi:hypothetical protein
MKVRAPNQRRFYIASMDHPFITLGKNNAEVAVPNSYFKLDPEFNLGGQLLDLITPLNGEYGNHPSLALIAAACAACC